MSDEPLKAYACLEPYECTGAVIFATSNIEARRLSADEFNDGDICGMSVKRAPWADKYGTRHKVPIDIMVENGWHFECCESGIRIDSDLYYYPRDVEDENGDWTEDDFLVGKKPVGFQESAVFACQEWADQFYEEKRKQKEFEDEAIKIYRGMVLNTFPDAVLIDSHGYGKREHIYTVKSSFSETRVVEQISIPFEFPGMKHSAGLQLRRSPDSYSKYGPIFPHFVCANGDLERFQEWAEQQKIIRAALRPKKENNDKD